MARLFDSLQAPGGDRYFFALDQSPGAQEITGSGDAPALVPTTAGVAIRGVQDLGSPIELVVETPVVVGEGTHNSVGSTITGTGALTAAVATLTASGVVGAEGVGDLTAAVASLAGTGVRGAAGAGTLAAQTPAVAGLGATEDAHIGVGELTNAIPLIASDGIRGSGETAASLAARTPRIRALVAVNGEYPSFHGLMPRARRRTLRNPLRCTLKVSNG